MNVRIANTDLDELAKLTGDPEIKQHVRYGNSNRSSMLDVDSLRPTSLPIITKYFEERNAGGGAGLITDANLVKKLKSFQELTLAPAGTPIKDVHSILTALKGYIGEAPNHWLFKENVDGQLLPWFVDRITHHPRERDNPEHVTVHVTAYRRTDTVQTSMTYYKSDLPATAHELLARDAYYLEKPETVAQYNEEVEQWMRTRPNTGTQMSASGVATYTDSSRYWGSSETLSMVRNGTPAKVVIDDDKTDEDESNYNRRSGSAVHSNIFWDKALGQKKGRAKDEESDDDKGTVVLPPHPYIRVFDLDKHRHAQIHINNLEDYVWDSELINKLVLPDDTKDLVEILINGTSLQLTDIVRGKMPGVIVVAVGDPGTGKTLTAEVMSEQIKLPLYPVQCSQLGTDETSVEKNLTTILNRATRWNAILLIDEADVYIRERGTDIQQNAIVGIFLRVLEYYRGVLFLTSNMATALDDAIVSRATAYIRYERPNRDELARIWAILANNFNAPLDEDAITTLVDTFPTITGRNVRSLLKLAKLLAAKRNQEVTVDLLVHIARFQNLNSGASCLPEAQATPVKAVVTNKASIGKTELVELMTGAIEANNNEANITISSLYAQLAQPLAGMNVFNIKLRMRKEMEALVDNKLVHLHAEGSGSVPNVYRKGPAPVATV